MWMARLRLAAGNKYCAPSYTLDLDEANHGRDLKMSVDTIVKLTHPDPSGLIEIAR
jgi:hypothetical protein